MRRAGVDEIRILHVDDEPHFTELTEAFLVREDDRFAVDTATRVSEGLERLESGTIDCVVSDYDMPGRDGIEFLEAVRERHDELPFILYTGKGSEAVASEAISAGVSEYLQKGGGREQYELLANRIKTHVTHFRDRRALERRESHLRQAQAVADLGSWELDIETERLYWSEEVYAIFDLDPDESLTFDRFLEFVHPADRAFVEREWAAALDGAEYDIEHRIVTDGGDEKWVRERADVSFEDGTPTTALGIVQDLTEGKRRDAERRLFREAVEAAGHSIYVTNREGEIEYVNPAFEEITGYKPREALGETPTILNSAEHSEAFFAELWETITNGEVWRGRVTNQRKSGERYEVDQTIAPITDDAGEISHFVAVNVPLVDAGRPIAADDD